MTTSRPARIGLETDILQGSMTGVGNYCFHLLKALMEAEPQLQFSGFSGLGWRPLDLETLARIEARQGKRLAETGAKPPSSQRLQRAKNRARSMLSRVDIARTVYRRVRASRFQQAGADDALDIFHAFKYLPPVDISVPTFPVVYDLSFVRYPDAHPKARHAELSRLPDVIAQAPLIHTISEFSKREIMDVYGTSADKIIVAPPAASDLFVPLGEARAQQDIAALDLKPGGFLLAVGTLEPRKNLRTLITAYGRLPAATRARAPLAIAGGKGWGDLALPTETEAMLRDGTLRFLGPVSDGQLRGLYEGAIALIFPSLYEGFGMPVVEAMACGTRVAHSIDSSMDEISASLALRAEAQDVDAWTAILRELIETGIAPSELRARLITQARTFSWRSSAKIVAQGYRTILNAREIQPSRS